MTHIIYSIAFMAHLTGLTLVAGTTLVDFIVTRQFWGQHGKDQSKSLVIHETLSKFPTLFGVGFLFLILSGIYMMYVTQGAYGEQIWFRIKFGVIIIIMINALTFGRRQRLTLKKLLSGVTGQAGNSAAFSKVKGKLRLFHVAQLVLFLTILTLSIFKFN